MLKELINNKKYIRLDGGMGTMLQKDGMPAGAIPEIYNVTEPERIIKVHRAYAQAGADIIYANTFGANRLKMKKTGKTVDELIKAGIHNAKKAAEKTSALVALDIGPIGQLLEPLGTLTFEEAYDIFREEIIAGSDADVIVIETMTDLYETKAALLAAKENSNKPVLVTMTFEESGRTFTGCSAAAMAITLEGLGADAVGVNCSLGPNELYPVVEEICKWTNLPVIVKPNAGLPDPVTGQFTVEPSDFAEALAGLAQLGVRIFGGCCGTTPEHLKAAYEILDSMALPQIKPKEIPAAVCSSTSVITITEPRMIGERINPTGKKRFQQALRENDISYILEQALQQTEAGADILDVNVGLPGIDEKDMMVRTVKALQSVSDTPLQLDSTDPTVLEAALRVYNGKPVVNSVNAEEKSIKAILPIVKKYGAAVVGLTLDEKGIPQKADDRFALAEKILQSAENFGIPKRDVYIDCLTLTVSAEQSGAAETLCALHRVKTELQLKTVLGVSNISFGLPNREAVNRTFLTMALQSGLDLPIMNPNIASMAEAVRAYKVLTCLDKNSVKYIESYGAAASSAAKTTAQTSDKHAEPDLGYALEHGLAEESAKITKNLLISYDPMAIINDMLIPALDKAGTLFEQGKIFLPQLILTAGAAQAAFGAIKEKLSYSQETPVSRGKIILATVKGDVHDIGKNIVKVLLENYGYTVIDLGKDVPPEKVVSAAAEHNAPLVGLSALMTTTLGAMKDTIALLNEKLPQCRTVVGGAVLTPEYAAEIHADFYAKDAKRTVDIAKMIFE
ncbi:MAG: homocysteine S-methyltransferase family protein [Ruminococcus sp.]|nr:homocysteine S-methyltransferase family protein [Ruminococcus sp.]